MKGDHHELLANGKHLLHHAHYSIERLRAITALQQERLAARHRGQSLLQLVALGRQHQRRQGLQAAHHRRQVIMVGPLGLLKRGRDHILRLATSHALGRRIPGAASPAPGVPPVSIC